MDIVFERVDVMIVLARLDSNPIYLVECLFSSENTETLASKSFSSLIPPNAAPMLEFD